MLGKVNPFRDNELDEGVGQFLNFLAVEKGASGNTIAAYRNDIQQFAGFSAAKPSMLQSGRTH